MRYKQKNKCLATWVRPELAEAFKARLKAEGTNANEFLGEVVEKYMRERPATRSELPSSVPPSDATLPAPASAKPPDGAPA